MRVLLVLQPHFLEPGLHFVRELSQRTELHVVLEIAPGSRGPLFNDSPPVDSGGLVAADPVLAPLLPAQVRTYWRDAASFQLIAFTHRRSIDPRTSATGRKLVDFVTRLRPDVIHLDDASLRIALALPPIPRVDLLSIHDPLPHRGDRAWRGHIARALLMRRAANFLLYSDALRPAFIRRYRVPASSVHVCHLGAYEIYRAWAGATGSRSDPVVLFFGRLSAYKGLPELYLALPEVAARVPGLRVVVAGRPQADYALPAPPLLPRGGRIEVIAEHVSPKRLAELLSVASVVACPYRDATQSGVVLTAYAFDVPVVASAVGGIPEYVHDGQTGLLVRQGDEHALAEALSRVLLDRSLRRRLAQGVSDLRTGDLAWSRAADRVLAVYGARTRTPVSPSHT